MSKSSKKPRKDRHHDQLAKPQQDVGTARVSKDDDKTPQMVLTASSSTFYSGPMPPPEFLKQYDDLLPGLANRIVSLVEAQSSHRRNIETKVIHSDIIKSYLGVGSAFILAALSIVCGSIVAFYASPTAGATISTAVVVSLVYAFLKGTNSRRAEREAKEASIPSSKP